MRNKVLYIPVPILLLLTACCATDDTRVPAGYPYNGNTHELNFTIYSSFSQPDSNLINMAMDSITYIRDSAQYRHVFGSEPDIDLNIYNLLFAKVRISKVSSVNLQERLLIDHVAKTYTMELRALVSRCGAHAGTGQPRINPDFNVSKFLLAPKVPADYTFKIKKYYKEP